MKRALSTAAFVATIFLFELPVFAVDTAPRISDREIIESLAELKAGQKTLQEQINELKESTQQQINELKESTQQQINELKESTNQRFDDLKWFLGTMIGVLMIINGAVLGYVLKRQGALEKSIETVKDEISFLKSIIEKLLPPKGVL